MNHKRVSLTGKPRKKVAWRTSLTVLFTFYTSRHHAWIGKPRWTAHYQHDASSHVIISTERNVLASLDASTGAIGMCVSSLSCITNILSLLLDWRQDLENDVEEEPKLTSQGS
jgi:hypothetical protein